MAKPSSKSVPPLTVRVPTPEEDNPAWTKVAIIASVGFVVGVAWPRVAGVKLGPNAPSTSNSETAAASPAPASSAPSSPAMEAPVAPAAPASASAAPSKTPSPFTVARGQIINCRTADSEQKKGSDCGQLNGIDAIVQPRIRKLSSCEAAVGASGKLSVVASFDFGSDRLLINTGKSSTVSDVAAFEVCLKSQFQGVSIANVSHEMPKYTVVYPVTFGTPASSDSENGSATNQVSSDGGSSSKTPVPATPNSSEVVWSTALVRDTPRSGQIVARLVRGTQVKVGSPSMSWYPIRFGNGFATEGWVYREAIGK